MHYQRWRKHGDPLAGRTFKCQRFFNAVVLTFDGDECLIWPYTTFPNGSGAIRSNGRTQHVSRLACEARHGPPPTPKHEAAHNCGKGHEGCVNPKHLRWATRSENQADRVMHGTSSRGVQNGSAKLTEGDIQNIRSLKGQKLQREIAEQFGTAQGTISRIHRGENWGWVR